MHRNRHTAFVLATLCALAVSFAGCHGDSYEPNVPSVFQSNWSAFPQIDRPWAGGDYWLNPLQAWRQRDGRLHCEFPGGDRNCVLLTASIDSSNNNFETTVTIALGDSLLIDPASSDSLVAASWVGFQIGLRGEFEDHRDDAVHGRGYCAGITLDGMLFSGDTSHNATISATIDRFILKLYATPTSSDAYLVTLQCSDENGQLLQALTDTIHNSWLEGLMALTSSSGLPMTIDKKKQRPQFAEVPILNRRSGGLLKCAFHNWKLEGEKVSFHPDRAFGLSCGPNIHFLTGS